MAATKSFLAGLAAATLLTVSAGAIAAPITLTDYQLDDVSAGLNVGVTLSALAGGGVYAATNTAGIATGHTTKLSNGGSVQTGVAGGIATGVSPGGSAATGAASSGSVTGTTLANIGVHGTVTGPGGSLSIGFTYVSGGTLH